MCAVAQGGVSRDVFEAWCEDSRNAVVVCDYAVSGTLAREILGGPTTILSKSGNKVSRGVERSTGLGLVDC